MDNDKDYYVSVSYAILIFISINIEENIMIKLCFSKISDETKPYFDLFDFR